MADKKRSSSNTIKQVADPRVHSSNGKTSARSLPKRERARVKPTSLQHLSPTAHSKAPPLSARVIAPSKAKQRELLNLLDTWDTVSPQEIKEQRETWKFLEKALDEDRLSDRRLFP